MTKIKEKTTGLISERKDFKSLVTERRSFFTRAIKGDFILILQLSLRFSKNKSLFLKRGSDLITRFIALNAP